MIHDINLHIENINSFLSYKDYNNINDMKHNIIIGFE